MITIIICSTSTSTSTSTSILSASRAERAAVSTAVLAQGEGALKFGPSSTRFAEIR